jgi:hypothetical protein
MRSSWLFAPMLLAACGASNRDVATAPSPASCSGERMLVVDNALNQRVDIYVNTAGGGVQFLSSAQPGRSEIALPFGPVKAPFAKVDKTTVQGRDGSTYGRQVPVKFSYACRTS